jgi:hypothetical protein
MNYSYNLKIGSPIWQFRVLLSLHTYLHYEYKNEKKEMFIIFYRKKNFKSS